jgi:hypothetical protein
VTRWEAKDGRPARSAEAIIAKRRTLLAIDLCTEHLRTAHPAAIADA